MDRRKLIPSMFHRRLVLLSGASLGVVIVLSAQLVRLSVVEGAERREHAEARLRRHSFIDTYRGRILDRDGNVLALDRAADAVAVRYDVITGEWELRRATADARRAHADTWSQMSPQQREVAINESLPAYETMTGRLWAAIRKHGDIDDAELALRRNMIKRDVERAAAAHNRRHYLERVTQSREGESAEWSPEPIREQHQPHIILPTVSTDVAYAFRKLNEELEGIVEVSYTPVREYPWLNANVRVDRTTLPEPVRHDDPLVIRVDGVADHILGQMRREVWAEDVARRPFRDPETGEIDLGWYRPGDVVGSRGLEAAFEDHLRGLRGMVEERRDTGETAREAPTPGRDLYTTLDIRLQARINALLSPELGLTRVQQWQAGWDYDGTPRETRLPVGTPLRSAAVVLDVETGHILSLVTMPTLAMGHQMSDRRRAFEQPFVNRASEGVYPPGSIIKPLIAAAAHAEGVANFDLPIHCGGLYLPNHPNIARCWLYRPPNFSTHGDLHLEEALARSCNIFFYTLSDRLGLERTSTWLQRFGLGRMLDVGLKYEITSAGGEPTWVGELSGEVPSASEISELRAKREDRFASIILGIGQGPVTWTPLQAANAYATLARSGLVRDATIVISDPRDNTLRRDETELRLHADVVRRIEEGLRQSVMEPYGTGYAIRYPDGRSEPIINARGVTVWAKTGTAQAPPLRLPRSDAEVDVDHQPDDDDDASDSDESPSDEVVIDDGTHAWFVGLVGSAEYDRPQYAIAVLVEYGGSGGRAAGPIANQIIRALQDEGYLPGSDESASGGPIGLGGVGGRP